jgi:REP element-mobilizing transposase RayT
MSGIYHVMLRGINKQNLFEDEEDRQRFIDTLRYYKNISNYEMYSYCLMDNHIHLLIRETTESVSQIIKRISSSYVYWYNQKYDRLGHLFQERFKSEVVESDEYVLMVLRYIHQNPVKAGITNEIRGYLWSSYHEYVGTPVIVDVDFALGMFSEDKIKATTLFRAYMDDKNTDECLDYTPKVILSDKEIINCLRKLGIASVSEVQGFEKNQRDEVVRKMKEVPGITIRHLARVTGIAKSVIDRT